jgi:hypothetical protein
MLIKFMAQESVRYLQKQYTTNVYEKNLIFWFELFFHNVFWLQCPSTALSTTRRPVATPRLPFNNRPRQSSHLLPLLREQQIKGLIKFFILGSFRRFPIRHFRRIFFEFRSRFYAIWIRWYAKTEIRRDISQDLAIFNSSDSLQFLFNCYYKTFRLADTVCNHRHTKC